MGRAGGKPWCYPRPVRPEMREGVELFNAGRYWDAHEAWEVPWNAARARGDTLEASYVQGLILLAAAIHKRRHYDSLRGGEANLAKARRRLAVVPRLHDGLDLEALEREVERALTESELRPQLPV